MSKRISSFMEYLKEKYYTLIFEKLKEHVYNNRYKLALRTHTIQTPNFFELTAAHFMDVKCGSGEEDVLNFCVKVKADVLIKGRHKREYTEDTANALFMVFCEGVLKDGLSKVTVLRIEKFDEKKYKYDTFLSKSFLPYVYVKDIDKYAEEFLKKYCPAALKDPIPLPIDQVLDAMQITAYPAPLPDGIAGRMYFDRAVVDVYSDGNTVPMEIDKGTILYMPLETEKSKAGSISNTIIHECVHWHMHYRYFELQKLLNPHFSCISCAEMEQYQMQGRDKAKERDWMEWQASVVAPRILIPEKTGRQKLQEILENWMKRMPDARRAVIMERAIATFAQFFNVSIMAARIRAMDLGYEQAAGVYNYVDGQYCPSISFAAGSLERNQSFTISLYDLIDIFYVLEDSSALDGFIYSQGRLVRNDPKYVDANSGKMTDYALEHADECCAIFTYENDIDKHYDDTYYSSCFLCKARKDQPTDHTKKWMDTINHLSFQLPDDARKQLVFSLSKQDLEKAPERKERSFGSILKERMDFLGLSHQTVVEEAKISEQTLSQYLNDRSLPKFDRAIILCCILELTADEASEFIGYARHTMLRNDRRDTVIRFLLNYCRGKTVNEWNELLCRVGVAPLKLRETDYV